VGRGNACDASVNIIATYGLVRQHCVCNGLSIGEVVTFGARFQAKECVRNNFPFSVARDSVALALPGLSARSAEPL
jgi:hypothetical protein